MVTYNASKEDLDTAIRCSIKAIDEAQKVDTTFSKEEMFIIYRLLENEQSKARDDCDYHSQLLWGQDEYFDWIGAKVEQCNKYIKQLEKMKKKIEKYNDKRDKMQG